MVILEEFPIVVCCDFMAEDQVISIEVDAGLDILMEVMDRYKEHN